MNLFKGYNFYIGKSLFIRVLLSIIFLILLTFGVISKSNDLGDDWHISLTQENQKIENQLSEENVTPFIRNNFEKQIHENNLYLENDINPDSNKLWLFILNQIDLVFIIALGFVALIVSIQDNNRDIINFIDFKKIYYERLFSYLFSFIVISLVIFVTSFIIGLILWPTSISNPFYFSYNSSQVITNSYILIILNKIILMIISSLNFIVIMYILHSSINNSLSYLFFIGFYSLGFYLTNLIENDSLAKFSYFTNLNFNNFLEVDVMNKLTLNQSLIKYFLYILVFILTGEKVFTKLNK